MWFLLGWLAFTAVLTYIFYLVAWRMLSGVADVVYGDGGDAPPEEERGQWRLVNDSDMVPPDFLMGGGMDGQVLVTYTEDGKTFLLERDDDGGWIITLEESEQ